MLPLLKPANVAASPLACLVRTGEAHRKLADFDGAGPPATEADRLARQIKELRTARAEADKLSRDAISPIERLGNHARRLKQLQLVPQRTHEARGDPGPRAIVVEQRKLSKPRAGADRS